MSRPLSSALDAIQTSAELRQPSWQVLVYDVLSGPDTIGSIVRGLGLNQVTGPRDFTQDVLRVNVEERAGDFVSSGIGGMSVTLELVDENNVFDPLNLLTAPTGDGRWLRRGNVIRIREGDARVDASQWQTTFTGVIVGQAGQARNRAPQADLMVKAVSREIGFLKYKNTSDTFAAGATYITIANTIALNDMGLDFDEVDLAGWGATTTALTVTQFVEEEPIVSIAKLMFTDGFLPRFTGEGKLTQTAGGISQAPARFYDDDRVFVTIDRPFTEVDPVNQVCVVGLDVTLTEVKQPRQVLAEVGVTTGYFTQDERIEVYWSKDRTVVARAPQLKVLQSVNAGINILGGGEKLSTIPAPQGGVGTVGAVIEIETGYVGWLLVTIALGYFAAAFIPDSVVIAATIPVGRVVEAVILIQILLLMAKIGRGKYEVTGEPIEFIYQEIRACAKVAGTLSADINEVEINNHLVQTQAAADTAARRVLFRQQALARRRAITMLHDLRLEPDDVFETATGRRFLIGTISRTLERNADAALANLEAFEVTPGISA